MNALITELHLALVFMTRLPLPTLNQLPEGGLARAMRLFPLVGLVVGGICALAYVLAHLLLPPALAGLIALAAGLWITGCLHEDGLADTADGFGGGRNKAHTLEIMRDSRIGSYGVVAVAMSLSLRATAIASLDSPGRAACALIAAHVLSRAAIPAVMQFLQPARSDGLGQAAGQPERSDAITAGLIAIAIAVLLLPLGAAFTAILAAAAAAAVIVHLALRHLGGHTGDVLGTVEQVAQTAALLAVVAAS